MKRRLKKSLAKAVGKSPTWLKAVQIRKPAGRAPLRGSFGAASPVTRYTGLSQGLCETTLTERFYLPCSCGTYPSNLGPCATFEAGAQEGRCVYCDHAAPCHPPKSDI